MMTSYSTLPRPRQDLRGVRRRLLGLSWKSARRSRSANRPKFGRPYQLPRPASLIAAAWGYANFTRVPAKPLILFTPMPEQADCSLIGTAPPRVVTRMSGPGLHPTDGWTREATRPARDARAPRSRASAS
jgi:hypothetical protein